MDKSARGQQSASASINDIGPNPFKFIDDIKSGINNLFFGSDIALLLTMFGLFLAIGIGGTIGFEVVLPNLRGQLFNNIFGVLVAGLFIWLLFKMKNDNIMVLGRSFNKAFILYLFILAGIIFIFSG